MSKTFRLGLFIVATLLILAAGIFIIGSRELLFKSKYSLKAQFHNVAGLTDGADVRVGGTHKGTVRSVALPNRPDGDVTVVMELESATRSIVKKDSVASISAEGLLGDKYIEVSFGSESAPQVKDGDMIRGEVPTDFSYLLKKADQLLDNANSAMQDIEGTATHMKSVTAKIDEGKGTMGALINDKTMYKQVDAGATAFQENMEALKHNFFLRGFFKKRGYEDSTELTKNAVSQVPQGAPMKVFEYDPRQLFDKPDTAKLKSEKRLTDAGTYLQQNKFGLAVVAATVDKKGDADKNRVLSEARAAVVRDWLAKTFPLDDTRIKTIGLGESDAGGELKILIYPPALSNAKK